MTPDRERQPKIGARTVAGRYQLACELGRGGMGVVWLAADLLTGRQVAVKELRPPAGLAGSDLAVFRQRALAEASSAARVHHPNAVTLYDVLPPADGDEAIYLIMEYVEGTSLAQLIAGYGRLADAVVARYGIQLLDVLAAAHALGITHRDIKPANIMIAVGGQVKLADFGISHMAGDTHLTDSGVVGTEPYMAPELLESGTITTAADLWALGATLYAAVAGKGPFTRESTGATLRAILVDPIPVPGCGPALAAAIAGLLQRDPARRATITAVREQLSQATSWHPGGPQAAPSQPFIPPPGFPPPVPSLPAPLPATLARRRGRAAVIAVSVALLLAAGAGSAVAVLSSHSPAPAPVRPPRRALTGAQLSALVQAQAPQGFTLDTATSADSRSAQLTPTPGASSASSISCAAFWSGQAYYGPGITGYTSREYNGPGQSSLYEDVNLYPEGQGPSVFQMTVSIVHRCGHFSYKDANGTTYAVTLTAASWQGAGDSSAAFNATETSADGYSFPTQYTIIDVGDAVMSVSETGGVGTAVPLDRGELQLSKLVTALRSDGY